MVSIATVLLTIRYVVWRCAINNWHDWLLSVPLLLAELFTAFHILGYQYTIWPRRCLPLEPTGDVGNLPVYVFIPTVNEGAIVLEPTIRGALASRARFIQSYPNAHVDIVVCNDGFVAGAADWAETAALAASLGVRCITRQIGGGAKAGNIENARRDLGAFGDCIIVVLDADQIPRPEFLLRTVTPFADPSIGWVQTRQYYRNCETRISRWAEHQASLFYDFVCPGKEAVNASFICGTNVAIRANVLDDIGGFPTDSITEDFAASIRTHHTWRSVYIRDVLAEGLGPMDLTAYFVQQSRWARGTLGVFLSDWRRILLPGRGGLELQQQIQYLLSGTHYLCGLRDLVFLCAAVFCLVASRSPIVPVTIWDIASYLLPYILATQLLIVLQSGPRRVLSSMFISYSSFPTLVWSALEAVANRRVRFMVTPKTASKTTDVPAIIPHIVIVAVCVGALAYSFVNGVAFTATKIVPELWVLYALVMIMPTFGLAKLTTGPAE
jgi:cellulose synthase/poly-beta-1,6-N-acetylglucosamine synthase-like glycosyltransferase